MRKFDGIPAGRMTFTAVPNVVFSELLPQMDDLAEVKVTLHIFYRLSQKKGSPRYVTLAELSADSTLMHSLGFDNKVLKQGLDKAAAHGALLQAEGQGTTWYFFNTAESRKALDRIARGELELAEEVVPVEPEPVQAPNIFRLYEQNIGPITPLIVDELMEAEKDFPPEVILDAFRIAAENNARKWSYVRAILSDWTRGNKHETTRRPSSRERRPAITGKLADVSKPK